MTPVEVEDLILKWYTGEERGFKYLDYGTFEAHYVVIKREYENHFVIITDRSTCKDGPFTKEKMEKLLGADKLIPIHSSGWQLNFKDSRSKGCQCGAWATNNPDCHARWCPKG